jgi:hypothetical protein
MANRLLLLIALLFKIATHSWGQNFYSANEYGVHAGIAQYFGDLNEHYSFAYPRPMLGASYKNHLSPYISLRLSGSYAKIGFKDALNTASYYKYRNLSFESDIFEANLMAEFNFFRYEHGNKEKRFTPYLTGGIGVFTFNAYTKLNGTRYELTRIGTEGQNSGFEGRRYSKISPVIPIGMGFKYWLKPGVNFGFEIVNRLSFSDYLDDVSTRYVGVEYFPDTDPNNPNPATILQDRSIELHPNMPLGRAGKQRGNNASMDQYLFIQFSISFQLKVYRCPNYMKELI